VEKLRNQSPCKENFSGGFFVATHDLKPILTKVRVVERVNEAPKTMRGYCPWGYVTEEHKIFECGLVAVAVFLLTHVT
jgi:hypothetical protein